MPGFKSDSEKSIRWYNPVLAFRIKSLSATNFASSASGSKTRTSGTSGSDSDEVELEVGTPIWCLNTSVSTKGLFCLDFCTVQAWLASGGVGGLSHKAGLKLHHVAPFSQVCHALFLEAEGEPLGVTKIIIWHEVFSTSFFGSLVSDSSLIDFQMGSQRYQSCFGFKAAELDHFLWRELSGIF